MNSISTKIGIILIAIIILFSISSWGLIQGITRHEDSQLTPLQPSQLTIETTNSTFRLKWIGTGSDIIDYYEVYRRLLDGDKWQNLASIKVVDDNTGTYMFEDVTADLGKDYIYGVIAVDFYSNKSSMSEISTTSSK